MPVFFTSALPSQLYPGGLPYRVVTGYGAGQARCGEETNRGLSGLELQPLSRTSTLSLQRLLTRVLCPILAERYAVRCRPNAITTWRTRMSAILRLPTFGPLPRILDNRLTDGGDIFSLTRCPLFTAKKIPGTHFC
jgi:hypothetical protein